MKKKYKLKKSLGLFDLFAISTGAMFSSGFFLLPGLAYAQAGPSVVLVYFFSGLLMVPAMFSVAEMATALPKSGGSYFFIARSLGPMAGTIGGFGIYISMVLKTAFTLLGMGAYTSLFFDLPIKQVAIALTVIFTLVNLLGVKQSSGLQKFLVVALITVLSFFIVEGITFIFSDIGGPRLKDIYTPLFPFGHMGLLTTIGFVFISYAGLIKIESVSEEVKNPERNIPLGMILSLLVTVAIYTIGVFIVVAVLDHEALKHDLTPIATAGGAFMNWLPANAGLLLIVIAAFAAFASTGNAGILSASRYPMAMARDKLIPEKIARVNRFHTPGLSLIITSGIVILFILTLTVDSIAKVGSTVYLVIIVLVNISVIILRKSKISSYDPGFKSPLFPYIQYFGIVTYCLLIIYMGLLPLVLSFLVFVSAYLWYVFYAGKNARKEGAIYHWFARMGKNQDPELEREFVELLKEKGLREDDPFNKIVVNTDIIIKNNSVDGFDQLQTQVSELFAKELDIDPRELEESFSEETPIDPTLLHPRVSMVHAQVKGIKEPKMKIVISKPGIKRRVEKHGIQSFDHIYVFFFLVSCSDETRLHLRLLMRISDILDRKSFVKKLIGCDDEQEVKEYLLHDEHYISLNLEMDSPTENLIDKKSGEIGLPEDTRLALVRRKDKVFSPTRETILEQGDSLTIIGDPSDIEKLYEKYR
jgi:basic amino acid/polyamine antiporter, APA family